ncbi:MAG: elongation factor P [Bdellovibrionales bacterium]|nr:elongation factor P [Bdellovibrionales bacterium]
MYTTSDFKKGLKIMLKGEPYVILDFQHVKPGKGNQFTRTKMSNLITGVLLDMTIRSGEKFAIPDIEYKNLSYIYKDSDSFYFMDFKSFETLPISYKIIGKNQYYLIDSLEVTACFFNNEVVSIEWPKSIIIGIKDTEPGFKGNTVSNTTKPAVTETGLSLQVPLHINKGDKIKINTKEGTYIERVK